MGHCGAILQLWWLRPDALENRPMSGGTVTKQ